MPYAWLATVPFSLLLVSFYNRFIPKWGSRKLFFGLILIVSATNLLFGLFADKSPVFNFLFFVWREIYIMLLFQLVWSVVHANVKFEKAKYLYGFFFGFGGVGSLLGAFFPSFFAVTFGSENLVFWILPIDLLILVFYLRMTSLSSGDSPQVSREKEGGFRHGVQLIRSSRFLIFALLIVVFMQTITAIADFQFNDFLGRTYIEKDIRTEYSARISMILQFATMLLQFAGAYFLINWLGFRRTHYMIPSLLGVSSSLLAFFPFSHLISSSFITCKALDFSVLGVVREMLYIPLNADEKYRARAVIDVFAHRSSKAFGSILIIGMTAFFSSHLLTFINIAIAILWMFTVGYGLKEVGKCDEKSTDQSSG
jgi:AAA family ATP:ADP antiporter